MRLGLTLYCFIALALHLFAQQNVPPCPMPGNSYFDAPLLDCCLDGYHFATPPSGGLEVPAGFCGLVDNSQWLAFRAEPRVTGMTLGLEVSNCSNFPGNQGVQMQVYGIGNFCGLGALFPVSNCIETATLDSVIATNLIPGHVYYVFLDGSDGDICEYTINILDRVRCTPPSPNLEGPTIANAGQTETYTLVVPPDTCIYEPHNPCNNIKQDTVTCNAPCGSGSSQDTTWTGPPGAVVVPNPGNLSADVTFGTESGYVKVVINGPCFHFEDSIFVKVCDIVAPILPSFYLYNCNIPPVIFVQGNYSSYLWSNGTTSNSTLGIDQGPLSVTVTDAQGCTATSSTFVYLVPLPIVVVNGPTSPVCAGEVVTLSTVAFGGSGNLSYAWSTGNQDSYLIINSAGNYAVTVTDDSGCTSTYGLTVDYYQSILTVLSPISVCPEALPYDFYGTNIVASGTYSEVITSWQGCDSTISQTITVLPPVTASISSSAGTMLPVGDTTTLDAGSGYGSYLWSNQSTGQTIDTDQPGTYSVTVTSTVGGCTATASITLTQASVLCPKFNLPMAPGDSCQVAPSFCANFLDGYCSSNMGYSPDVPGNLGSIAPCTIENNQWLKFVACGDSVQFVFTVDNCLAATGMQFFVLQTTDCQTFTAIANCTDIIDGGTDSLLATGLVPGETYYLMVDGIDGDICDWHILSTSGISDGVVYEENNTPGQVTGPDGVCAGGVVDFTFTGPICGFTAIGGCPAAFQQFCDAPHLDTCITVQYDTIWHVSPAGTAFVNNDSTGLTVSVQFPDTLQIPPGGFIEFTVSVEIVAVAVDTLPCWNNCLGECSSIISDTVACGILPWVIKVCAPDFYTQQFSICPGDCVDFMGETYCSPGTYTIEQTDVCGCTDTYTVTVNLEDDAPPVISAPSYTCDPTGSEYTVSFDVFSTGGNLINVDGQPLNGSTFTSQPIPSGQSYNFLVASFGICNNYQIPVSGSYTCPPCLGDTIDLGNMQLCAGECFSLQGNTYCSPGSYEEVLYNPSLDCFETYQFSISALNENQLAIGPATEICDATSLYYSVGFSILDGVAPFFVNGNPINGNFYQSGLIPSGQAYAFTVTDAATCSPQQVNINGVFTCACVNNPGTMAQALISKCEGEMANADFNNDAVLGPNDLQVFILHTASGSSLGTVIGTNTTGNFGYVPGLMNYGQTYYISPAVGPNSGGMVDMNSPCFELAPGQPVVFYEVPEVSILPPDTLTCTLNSLVLYSLPSGGSGDYKYQWDGPNSFAAIIASPTVDLAGTYSLLLTDNLTGCFDQSATVVASNTAQPVFTVTNSEINCQQPNAILEAASPMPGLNYTWTFPTGDVMTGMSIVTNIPGDYSVTAQGPNGCTADATTFVTDNGLPPSLSATGGIIACNQPTTTLVASSNASPATFTWTLPDSSISTGPSLDASLVGTYTVSVMAANGCTAEAESEVVQGIDPDLVPDIEKEDPTCFGFEDGSIKVLGTTGGTDPYDYTLNDSLMGDFFQNLAAGIYLLTIVDANGCTDEESVELIDPPMVTVAIDDDQFINLGETVTLTMQSSISPDSIVWHGPNGQSWTNVSSLSLSPMESGTYSIVISDVNSCRSSDTTNIYVNGQGRVFVPNVFSPNGDNKNDVMMVFAGGDVQEITLFQIFDRWGEMVFEDKNFQPNDPSHGWNGRHKGKQMDPAVFVAKAEVLFIDGTKKIVTGDVILMR